MNEHNEIVTTTGKHAWISSRPLNRANVHERCNLAARYRWGIESNFLVEKHDVHGYTNEPLAKLSACHKRKQE